MNKKTCDKTKSLPWLLLFPDVDLSDSPPVQPRYTDPDVRVWSERDTAFEILRDRNRGVCRSLRAYARLFGWGSNGHKILQSFLGEKLHLGIRWDNRRKVNAFVELSTLYSRFNKSAAPSYSPEPRPAPTQQNRVLPRVLPPRKPTPDPVKAPCATQPHCLEPKNQDNKYIYPNAHAREARDQSSPRSPRRSLPEGFAWDDRLERWARRRYPEVPIRKFRNYVTDVFVPQCRAHDYRYADFHAACVSWINRHMSQIQEKAKQRPTRWRGKRPSWPFSGGEPARTQTSQEFEGRKAGDVWSQLLAAYKRDEVPPRFVKALKEGQPHWCDGTLEVSYHDSVPAGALEALLLKKPRIVNQVAQTLQMPSLRVISSLM